MVITYHGNGCFRVQSGPLSLLVDPENARMKPDIFLKTLIPLPPKDGEDARGITGPGEYEQKGVRIRGFPLREESSAKFLKAIYVAEMEELRLAFLGHLSSAPNREALDEFDEIDILFIPASGKPFLLPEAAAKLARQIDPKIVVPSFIASSEERARASVFAKELGQSMEREEKLTLKKKELPARGPKVVALNAV